MTKKYGIEIAAENLLKELTRFVKAFRLFVFRIPKNKMDKMIYATEILVWTLLTVVIVYKIFR